MTIAEMHKKSKFEGANSFEKQTSIQYIFEKYVPIFPKTQLNEPPHSKLKDVLLRAFIDVSSVVSSVFHM